jgi:GxxExxY protein
MIKENELAREVVNTSFQIHKELGPGLFESVYEEILNFELLNAGFKIQRQKTIPVVWKGIKLDLGFRADLIVNDKLLVEIKSIADVAPVHQKQVLTYLRLTKIKLGLLINFNESLIKYGIQRIVNCL